MKLQRSDLQKIDAYSNLISTFYSGYMFHIYSYDNRCIMQLFSLYLFHSKITLLENSLLAPVIELANFLLASIYFSTLFRLDFSGLLNIGTVSCGVFEAFNKTLSDILGKNARFDRYQPETFQQIGGKDGDIFFQNSRQNENVVSPYDRSLLPSSSFWLIWFSLSGILMA